jgi:hypothetical protein
MEGHSFRGTALLEHKIYGQRVQLEAATAVIRRIRSQFAQAHDSARVSGALLQNKAAKIVVSEPRKLRPPYRLLE